MAAGRAAGAAWRLVSQCRGADSVKLIGPRARTPPVTKQLVEMHGGSLDLQSEVGVGTTVTVRFPRERIVRVPEVEATGSPAA